MKAFIKESGCVKTAAEADCRAEQTSGDQKGPHTARRPVHQEDAVILDVHTPHSTVSNTGRKTNRTREKQTTTETDDLNTSLSARTEPAKRNIGNDTELDSAPANRAINTRRKLHATAHTALPGTRGPLTDTRRQDTRQDRPRSGRKTHLDRLTRAETIQGTFSDHHGVREIRTES